MNDGDRSTLVCIITGAGRGIGRFTAETLATRGARVAICARTETELDEVSTGIEKNTGHAPLTASLDVCNHGQVEEFVGHVSERLGAPGLVVNNAAQLGPVGTITEVDLDDWYRTLTVNVGGIASVCAAVAPQMAQGGAIVNLAGGGIGGPSMAPLVSAYTASKAAVVTLTEALAGELGPAVTVNAVAPGPIVTRFMEPVLAAGPERAGALYSTTVAQREAPAALEPFLDLVLYLASPEGHWLTGRLLSARWDTVAALEEKRAAIEQGSLLTLRRIDDALYREMPR